MKELLNLNNISLFLILLIIILLLHTRYKKRNHLHYQNNRYNENFVSILDTIDDKINEEIFLTDNIKDQIISLKTDKKNNKDLAQLSKYNNDIINKSSKNNNYNNIINKLHNKRISNINQKVTELYPTYNIDPNKPNSYDINYIKNPIHNISLEVEDKMNDTYKIKINDDNCIYYDNDNDNDKYNTTKCNDLTNQTKQSFNLNKVEKKDSCYNYPLNDNLKPESNDISLENCEGVNLIKKQNKEQYINDYNEHIPSVFNIDEYSYELSPKEFYYITPNIIGAKSDTDIDTDNIKQCLTVDKNEDNIQTFSFKTCKNLPNQRWNGIKNTTNLDNSC